jgi:hypothetical protein
MVVGSPYAAQTPWRQGKNGQGSMHLVTRATEPRIKRLTRIGRTVQWLVRSGPCSTSPFAQCATSRRSAICASFGAATTELQGEETRLARVAAKEGESKLQTRPQLSHEDVRTALRTFLATASDAKSIGFIRISGEGLEHKPIVTAPDSDYVRLGPWEINVVTRDAILESKKALLVGEVVRIRGKLTIQINRIIWHRPR